MSTLSIKLPKVIDERLTATAERRKKAKTALIVEALREYLAKEDEEITVTAYDLAKDFSAAVKGRPTFPQTKSIWKAMGNETA